jgi:hypothetical protein
MRLVAGRGKVALALRGIEMVYDGEGRRVTLISAGQASCQDG